MSVWMLTEEILVIEDGRIGAINTFSIQTQKTDECLMKRFSRVTTTQTFQIEYMLRESGRALAETRKTVEDVLLTFKKSKTELGAQLLTKFEAVHRTTCEENALVSNLIEEALKSVPAKKLDLDHKPVDDVNFVMNLVQLVVDKVNDIAIDLGAKEDQYQQMQDEYRKASSQTTDHKHQQGQSAGTSKQKTSPGMASYDEPRGPCYTSAITISAPARSCLVSSRTEAPATQQGQRPSRLLSPATQQQGQSSRASRPVDTAREPSRSSRNASPSAQQDERRPSGPVSTEHEASRPLRRTAYRTKQQDFKPPSPVSPAYEPDRSSRTPSPASHQGQQYKSLLLVSTSHEASRSTRTASPQTQQDQHSKHPLTTTYQINTSSKSTVPANPQDQRRKQPSPSSTAHTSSVSSRAASPVTPQNQDSKHSRTTYKTVRSFTINTGPATQYDQGCRPSSPVCPEHESSRSTRTEIAATRQEQHVQTSRPTLESNRSSGHANTVTQQDQRSRASRQVSPKHESNISSRTVSQQQDSRTQQKSAPSVSKVTMSQVSTAQISRSAGTGSHTVSPTVSPESPQCSDGKGRSHRVVTIVQEPIYDKQSNSRPNISGPFKEYSFDLPERSLRRKNKIHPQICEEQAFCYGYGLHITVYTERRKLNGITLEDGMP